ncbi:hypothetical protein [Sporotomaculum syntrophicum]|nr:hypothetical protein [Sporotomaculum syntrophicum]
MYKCRPSRATVEVMNISCCASTPLVPNVVPQRVCSRCNNLLQNPSFEAGLDGWVASNVIAADSTPFEGTQVARMGSGVASLSQDIALTNLANCPLFINFNAFPGTDNNSNGNLVVEVLWLDKNRVTIATGLRKVIPNFGINTGVRLAYFDITDQPPADAAFARLMFSKGTGTTPNDIIEVDQVILASVNSINLVQNPGFELGLTGWTATTFTPVFIETFEGAAAAFTSANGTLLQDIPITDLPSNSSFLLSFAASVAESNVASLSVQVLWLNAADVVIGTGLNITIPENTLDSQRLYLTYLDITNPAPGDAVKARILFTASDLLDDSSLRIDQVILAGVGTQNLVRNPSFENGFDNWTPVNVTIADSTQAYEGNRVGVLSAQGGVIFQDIPIVRAIGHCFLLNFGLKSPDVDTGLILAEVHWLDNNNREIGQGLSLVIPTLTVQGIWVVYTGITEPAPPGTATARVQFSKSIGGPNGLVDIDKVVFGRLV